MGPSEDDGGLLFKRLLKTFSNSTLWSDYMSDGCRKFLAYATTHNSLTNWGAENELYNIYSSIMLL